MVENKITQFDNIYFNLSKSHGKLRLASSGLGWKSSTGGNPITIASSDLKRATWSKAARGWECKLVLRKGDFIRMDGFQEQDHRSLEEALKDNFGLSMESKEHAIRGWNWGKTEFDGQELVFNVSQKPAFEIPLSTVANTNLSGKNEVVLEFALPGDSGDKDDAADMDELVEMRFFVPGQANNEDASDNEAEDGEQVDAATALYNAIKDKADIGAVAGESIVTFSDTLFLTPRGRYDIDLYPSSLRLRGKTYDYTLPYTSISRLFLLPKPDLQHILFVVGLEPPLRQGQTRYPFLVAQVPGEEESEVELNLEDDVFEREYKDKLQKKYDQPTYEVMGSLFKGLTSKKVITPSVAFRGAHGQEGIKCSMKANEGHFFCLDKSFLFVPKPTTYVPISDVSYVTLSRVGGGSASRTFDLTFTLSGSKGEIALSNINKEEQSPLITYLKLKSIKVKNEMTEDTTQLIKQALAEEADMSDDDEDVVMKERGADDDEDEESPDEDFAADDDSDDDALEYDSDASVAASSGDGEDE
ncbi:SSrecog-domain-containing protein [Saitoella complicata NRRL Y-17804]|nr:SSrecog-domain-containing protein [Saitoella complicata NRRL Y-17804]ODQ51395.1 SSrecog-domain-containing protein [Saitoella complicata NRRL Y-17804]